MESNGHTPQQSDIEIKKLPGQDGEVVMVVEGEVVNVSGHRDQLQRNYGILSICGLALTVDNAWVAIGTSLTTSIYNGGPPGVLYEFLVAVFYYSFIAASVAELASSVPTAGGVYHWASLTPGPKWGRMIGFFAGWTNFFGWLFDLASIVFIMGELLVQMYALYHPDYVITAWSLFVALVAICWLCIIITIFGNRLLPALQNFGLFMVLVGGIVTICVISAMPKQHASSSFVWTEFNNQTGWSAGTAFLLGVLNGSFTIGTPDSATHLAEELPNPSRDIPRAVLAQMGLGTIFAFSFAIALSYSITSLDDVINAAGTSSFPLGQIYLQATNGNTGATFGLLFIIFLCLFPCLIGTFLTVGRTWWALARDQATPFPKLFASVNESLSCPIPATIFTGIMTTAFGAITLGSRAAFNDLVGSFVVLTTVSYLLAILPHLITGRKNVRRGVFWMSGPVGFIVNATACVLIVLFDILFCFPYALPVTVDGMNYNSVILVGVIVVTSIWWIIGGRKYQGPKIAGQDFRRASITMGGGLSEKA